MMVVVAVLDVPDDAANDPVMVMVVMMMPAAMMVMPSGNLHIAVRPVGRVLLRLTRRRCV